MSGLIPCVRTRVSAAVYHVARPAVRSLSSTTRYCAQRPGAGESFIQANDPSPKEGHAPVSKTNEVAVDSMGAWDRSLQESAEDAERQRQVQAPNRKGTWSRSQMPRELAMTGPRFEQTIMEAQPQPYAAIELIHKQPVRWTDSRIVACDGGGGPLGHPKIFINVDKPQVCWCTYCGLPYAHKHHKEYLKSLPSTPYPLEPSNDPDQVQMPQTLSQHGEIEGQYPRLKGELEAEGGAFSQR